MNRDCGAIPKAGVLLGAGKLIVFVVALLANLSANCALAINTPKNFDISHATGDRAYEAGKVTRCEALGCGAAIDISRADRSGHCAGVRGIAPARHFIADD